jgi:hypothetical protein
VGVHHLHALIFFGENAIMEVHAGFYMQTTTLMELLMVTLAEEGDGMGPGVVVVVVVVVVVSHLLGGQMRVPGDGWMESTTTQGYYIS